MFSYVTNLDLFHMFHFLISSFYFFIKTLFFPHLEIDDLEIFNSLATSA